MSTHSRGNATRRRYLPQRVYLRRKWLQKAEASCGHLSLRGNIAPPRGEKNICYPQVDSGTCPRMRISQSPKKLLFNTGSTMPA